MNRPAPVVIVIHATELNLCRRLGQRATADRDDDDGVILNNDGNPVERLARNVSSLVSTLAFYRWWGGGMVAPTGFLEMAWAQDNYIRHQRGGDLGYDMLGRMVDIKSTQLKTNPKDPLAFRLSCTPDDLRNREKFTFVHALVSADQTRVTLTGWALGSELLDAPMEASGQFQGKHTIPARELHPLPPMASAWLLDWRNVPR